MSLRLRLVLGLVALVAVGLGLLGVVTHAVYSDSEYRNLDTQIDSVAPALFGRLEFGVRRRDNGPPPGDSVGRGPVPNAPGGELRPGAFFPPGTYAELIAVNGHVEEHFSQSEGVTPELPRTLPAVGAAGVRFTVPASSGSGHFRVLVEAEPSGQRLVVAASTSEVAAAVNRLALIETVGGVILLVVLSLGAWFILRRELRPLERMAATARGITAGHLSDRVAITGPAEVDELGLALNGMLDGIERAFRSQAEAERRLRRFVADAAHELRTPLTSIRGFAELFRVGGDAARVDLPTILRRIEQESTRMGGLVEDLLLLARLDERPARAPGDLPDVDLVAVLADAATDLRALDPSRAVTVDAPEHVIVAGDEALVRQAVGNLTTNARVHTPPGTGIDLSVAKVAGDAVLAVRDHGPGLDEGGAERVFDRFWQADTSRSGAGVGLGLSIVAGIVREHGGRAEADNPPGGGARFRLFLPTREPAEPDDAGSDGFPASSAPSPREL